MDPEDEDLHLPPANINSVAFPFDPELRIIHELYSGSKSLRKLQSEQNREAYAEVFIENTRLGTLADLCVRALARACSTGHAAPIVQHDPLKLRIHYDTLDVNLPLKQCYFVDSQHFWRRVVLSKVSDQTLALKKVNEYDWKSKGISIKYVEMVEACPAEFWPEKEMTQLALLVKDYVQTMHIKNLQSLTEHSFKQYYEENSEVDVTSEESEELEISSDEPDTDLGEEAIEEEEVVPVPVVQKKVAIIADDGSHDVLPEEGINEPVLASARQSQFESSITDSFLNIKCLENEDADSDDSSDQDAGIDYRAARHLRNAQRQKLRDLRQAKRDERALRREHRLQMRKQPEEEIVVKKKRKKSTLKIKGVFDIEVEPEPEDDEDLIVDKRNKEKLVKRIKDYDYPPDHCHHIDLSFVRYFENLVSFTLEFLGPKMGRDFHKRHLNFSVNDIQRLSKGLKNLTKLKIFRLRNSRMDCTKLQILVRALRCIESLEVIDFGNDQLTDDCGPIVSLLFDHEQSIKSLELEHNGFGQQFIDSLGFALTELKESKLEYLGIAHNPLGDVALRNFYRLIVGTQHIEELHMSGVEASSGAVEYTIAGLLLNHPALKRLDMAAIPLHKKSAENIIRALETNTRITHFDCRACDLDSDEEFETAIIVRRNRYIADNEYLGDATKTEADIENYLKRKKHPILAKIEREMLEAEECIRLRPSKSTIEVSIEEEEEKEEEFDIWASLGIKTKTEAEPKIEEKSVNSAASGAEPFVYNPNEFSIDEIREYVYRPGPVNRYSYFRRS